MTIVLDSGNVIPFQLPSIIVMACYPIVVDLEYGADRLKKER